MTPPTFRRAVIADLPAIVALLADDPLGAARETAVPVLDPRCATAFAAITDDPNQLLAVAVAEDVLIGCLQLSFIPGLSRRGMTRGQIESVRIAKARRGSGFSKIMLEWAMAECRHRGCGLVQLTTDKSRPDASRFYETLGFVPSHEGLKLTL